MIAVLPSSNMALVPFARPPTTEAGRVGRGGPAPPQLLLTERRLRSVLGVTRPGHGDAALPSACCQVHRVVPVPPAERTPAGRVFTRHERRAGSGHLEALERGAVDLDAEARARRGWRRSRARARSARVSMAWRIGCSERSNSSSGSFGESEAGCPGSRRAAAARPPARRRCPDVRVQRTPNAWAMSAICRHSVKPPAMQMSGCTMSTARGEQQLPKAEARELVLAAGDRDRAARRTSA